MTVLYEAIYVLPQTNNIYAVLKKEMECKAGRATLHLKLLILAEKQYSDNTIYQSTHAHEYFIKSVPNL